MHAMPVMIVVLCLMAIAYRYYSAFLAAKVAVLDASRPTPAERLNDGQNYPSQWWLTIFPGLLIVVIVLCVNFVGDGLRDALDPQQRRMRA